MDEIVMRVNKLNFQTACDDNCKENFEQNLTLVSTESIVMGTENLTLDSAIENDLCPSEGTPFYDISKANVEVMNDEEMNKETVSNRRVPMRSAKMNGLLKLKNRVISKPMKRIQTNTAMGSSDILKMYMNQNLTKFRPSPLETIFEEPESAAAPMGSDNAFGTDEPPLRLVGLRRLRRSIMLSNGLNPNKSVVKQRRAKIKKHFGRRNVLGKYPLEDFITLMHKNDTKIDNDEDKGEKNELSVADNIKKSDAVAMEE